MARLARGAAPWLLWPLAAGLLLVYTGYKTGWRAYYVLGAAFLLAFLFFLNFFRDPDRVAGPGIVSPAHGKVTLVDQVDDPDVGRADRMAVFMSPLDVHVNRFPMDGTVLSVTHRPGGYLPAFKKESERNERVETVLETALGRVKVVQIAGAVARRIVPYVEAGAPAVKGERYGLIRLGSRCDLLIPVGAARWVARLGDKVQAGATTLAEPTRAPATGGPAVAVDARAPNAPPELSTAAPELPEGSP